MFRFVCGDRAFFFFFVAGFNLILLKNYITICAKFILKVGNIASNALVNGVSILFRRRFCLIFVI